MKIYCSYKSFKLNNRKGKGFVVISFFLFFVLASSSFFMLKLNKKTSEKCREARNNSINGRDFC